MTAGISTASLFQRVLNEDALPLFHEWGVGEAEVFLTSFCEYEPRFAKELAARKGNVHINSVHVLNTQFEPQLYSAHPRVRADAFAYLEKTMRSARVLGANYYTFHGLARIKRTFSEDMQRTGAATARIAEFCAKFGVQLSFENVEWAFYNRPGIFRALKEFCPNLKGTLDVKQARISGFDYQDYLNEMCGSISHVHVSDLTAEGKMCLPGRGAFDFDRLFSRLRDAGFTGCVLLESYAKDYGDLGELKTAYEFLAEKAYRYS